MREKNSKIYLLIPSFSQPYSLLAKLFTSHLRRVKNCFASDTLKDLLEKSKLCGHVRMRNAGKRWTRFQSHFGFLEDRP